MQRLETEAHTLAKLRQRRDQEALAAGHRRLTVDKGYETALGAALGDDLDAPVDPSAPIHWAKPASADGDPALPEGVEPLAEPRPGAGRAGAPAGADRRRAARARRRAASRSSSPASGWCRPKATCGAGTALSPPPTRRPARRGASPSAPASSTSRTSWSRPASTRRSSVRRWRTPSAELQMAASSRRRRAAKPGAPRQRERERRARAPCRRRARDQPPRRAQVGAVGSPSRLAADRAEAEAAPRDMPRPASPSCRRASDTETRLAAVRSRHRRPSPHGRRGARRGAGARARDRARRPPRAAIPAERTDWQNRRTAPPPRSRPSRPASPRPRPSAASSKTRPPSSRRSAAR